MDICRGNSDNLSVVLVVQEGLLADENITNWCWYTVPYIDYTLWANQYNFITFKKTLWTVSLKDLITSVWTKPRTHVKTKIWGDTIKDQFLKERLKKISVKNVLMENIFFLCNGNILWMLRFLMEPLMPIKNLIFKVYMWLRYLVQCKSVEVSVAQNTHQRD